MTLNISGVLLTIPMQYQHLASPHQGLRGVQASVKPWLIKYPCTRLTWGHIVDAIAWQGPPSPKDYFGRALCWIAGVNEVHFKKAEEARRVKAYFDAHTSEGCSKYILPSLSQSEWRSAMEVLYERLLLINCNWELYVKDKILMETVETKEFESVRYQMPLWYDDSSTSKVPQADLCFTYEKAEGHISIESSIKGRGHYFAINTRSLALTLSRHRNIHLEQSNQFDKDEISFSWKAVDELELFAILDFYEYLYSVSFSQWAPELEIITRFPRAWDSTWYPTFVSTMLELESIPREYRLDFLQSAIAASKRCESSCLDQKKLIDAAEDIALNTSSSHDRSEVLHLISTHSKNFYRMELLLKKLLARGHSLSSFTEEILWDYCINLLRNQRKVIAFEVIYEMVLTQILTLKEKEPFLSNAEAYRDKDLFKAIMFAKVLLEPLLKENLINKNSKYIQAYIKEIVRVLPKDCLLSNCRYPYDISGLLKLLRILQN